MFRKTPLVQRSPEEDELQRQANLEFNRTGLPDQLKVGIESLSGIDLSDVRVHANSEKPAQLNALAYTQGTDIHVGPGQEPSLPHEAWHVVQQKQGRVKPTIQTKGVSINDDEDFEHEADVMGAKAAAYQAITPIESDPTPSVSGAGSRHLVVQRERDKAHETNTLNMIYDALKENMPDNEDENTREGEVSQIAYVHFGNTAKEEYFATDIEGQIRDSDYLTPQGMGEKPGHNQQTQEEWERAIRGTTYTEGGNYFWIRNTEYEQEGGKPDERIILNLKSQHDAAAIIAHI
ncbi:MAG: DUF4157 domain-containing protein [Nitrospirales bacterium]|nr:DUF4157 domain-containing protein [Nitrospirales bacterium]